MAYYRGDYYRGDYYRGDPFLGAVVGRAGAAAGKLIARFVATRMGRTALATGAAAETARRYIASQRTGTGGTGTGAETTMPGGAVPDLGPLQQPGTGVVVKQRRVLTPQERMDLGIKGIGKVRRRINPLNPRALKRALRRAEGFEAFAKKTVNALYKTVDGRRVKTFKRTKRRSR